MAQDEKAKKSFKDTLNLPTTDFPIRGNSKIEDPKIIDRWKQDDIYAKAFEKNKGKTAFLLHDGPPYANGNIHLGHAYNKILKDIISKSERMAGKHVPITPGWDCHGLPIELKVSKENPEANAQELRKKCRESANHWIKAQKEQFKDLGVLMDWDNPYLTMDYKQEANTVRAFATCVDGGYISRKNKTVPWCSSCKTVLASAEIEHKDRKDPSVYVEFELDKDAAQKVFNTDKPVSMLMWTTTPWTIPLNRALFLKPKAEYELLEVNGKQVVVGAKLSDKLCALMSVEKKVLATCTAEDLVGSTADHPFIEGQKTPILADNFVGLEDGTAVVHSAPGCGPEDYEMGVRYGLEIFSPLSGDGKYTEGIKPVELEGMEITAALGWVLKKLIEKEKLLFKASIKHPYPHCWRCRNGLMFRATKQWFCELGHNDLQKRALKAIESIKFWPAATRNHLKSTIASRYEWCLSRQRVWGTPIVAVICIGCDKEHTSPELIKIVAQGIEKEGVEYWADVDVKEVIPAGLSCSECKGTEFKKEQDILDVWFDSGVTHTTVLKERGQKYPADLYLEGIDQHRGWFQSSLLTSLMLDSKPAMKGIATHGFTVDDKGRKMSKSLGNVMAPDKLIEQIGTDGLRLWVSAINIEGDATVSKNLISNVGEVNRKVRNTARFLLSNLYDFDIKKDAIELKDMRMMDRYALHELALFSQKVRKAYEEKNITAVFHALTDYCTVELSSFYLDIIKDRLYTDQADGVDRRSAQTVCWHILDVLIRLMAPVMSITAEQISDHYQADKPESIHLQDFRDVPFVWEYQAAKTGGQEKAILYAKKKEKQWELLRSLRSSALKAIEKLRQQGIVKHSLEAKVTIVMDTKKDDMSLLKELFDEVEKTGQSKHEFLKEFFIISDCQIIDYEDVDDLEDDFDEDSFEAFADCIPSGAGLKVKAEHADGAKCPRCWKWEASGDKDGLCLRCKTVVERTVN
ncbi:MAG: isoleucyl-tRNA synthetase [Alteromonas naphthalenivorans]|jgi:isoleucyl-tRNA synthetase